MLIDACFNYAHIKFVLFINLFASDSPFHVTERNYASLYDSCGSVFEDDEDSSLSKQVPLSSLSGKYVVTALSNCVIPDRIARFNICRQMV